MNENRKGKIIVIANRKGGVGKTTTSINLASALVLSNYKVLVVDFDPQKNMTDGITRKKYKKTVVGLLKNEHAQKCVFKTRYENLDIIPGNDFLASEDVKDQIIQKQLEKLKGEYDYIIIDTSPYFNKLTAELLLVHDFVIVPCELSEDSIHGMLTTISELKTLCNNIKFKILFTKVGYTKREAIQMHDLRTQLHSSIIFITYIRYNKIPIDRARDKRKPLVLAYDKAKASADYMCLAKELSEEL